MNIEHIKKIIYLNPLIYRPFFFNSLRYLVTGNQNNIKNFVCTNLKKYRCKNVLDVCCGTADFVQQNGIKYVGIDINECFISFAKKKYENTTIKLIVGNALSLPFPNKQFEASLLISTLHHFSDSDLIQLLTEVKRVTKRLVIIADLVYSPPSLIKRFFVRLDQGNYVRPEKQKVIIVSRFFKIKSTKIISAGLAEQYGIVAEVK